MVYQMSFEKLPKKEGFTKDWFIDFHAQIQLEVDEWSKESQYIQVYVFSEWVWGREFEN